MLHLSYGVLLFAVASSAQQHITVPMQAEARDGVGVGWVPGFDAGGREQFLIGSSHLTSIVGRTLTAITFRRDGFEPARGAGLADLSIFLSVSPLADIRAANAAFSANRGPSPSLVFQGRIALPSSPRLLHRDGAQWTAPDAVTISFTRPWTYLGGHLCIEVAGQPVAGAGAGSWSIDAEADGVTGYRFVIGTGCGAVATRALPQAAVDARQLRPGATARFTCAGEAGATGLFMIALGTLGTPVDLAFLGAPGCQLWLMPELVLPSLIGQSAGGRPGATRADLTFPPSPHLIGAGLATQWLLMSPSGIETSNALRLSLAGLPAQIDGTVVRAVHSPGQSRDTGLLQVGRLPVMRLHF